MGVKIYTKTGDKGATGLYGGKRVQKNSLRINAIGSVDELNSMLGVVIEEMRKSDNRKELEKIQQDLFEIGSLLANPLVKENKELEKRVAHLELLIDILTEKLTPLRNFILPGGGEAGSLLHLARAVARRAERSIVGLREREKISEEILKYFNRLSDLLFTMARYENHKERKRETLWVKQ